MSAVRILHVDDEPDIREIVEMALGLNAEFEVRGCACGADAITAAAEWAPYLILLDVMMPGMDGPTTLAHLRRNPRTADIPVLFMTARAQAREVEQFIALGAQGVISKPFDPMTLAFAVRNHLQSIRLEALRALFVRRARNDAATLAACRSSLRRDASPATIGRIREIAHGLAGAAGLFGYGPVSRDAAALEEEALMALRGARADANTDELTEAIDRLLSRLEDDWETPPAQFARSARA